MSSVKKALAKYDAVQDVNCDASTTTCTIKVPADYDVDGMLNEIVDSGNTHVKGWSKN